MIDCAHQQGIRVRRPSRSVGAAEEVVMKKVVAGVALAIALAVAAPTRAQTIDAQHVTNDPGATVLLPYFEAQVPKKIGGKAPGTTTLFSINNASATAILAHVTIWSDLAVPVLAFNVYLTGYDVQQIDMIDILNGKLPRTASVGQDQQDTISNHGSVSQDINFATCNGQLPPPDVLDEPTIQHIRAALTGKPSALFANQCFGRDYLEKKPVARGFITADNSCTTRLPNDIQYFIEDITTQNVLWGDFFFLNKSKKIGRGDALVAIRASQTDPETSGIFQYSFYHSTNGSFVAVDKRQPLGSVFAGRFVNVPKHPLFSSGTSALVWRDTKANSAAFPCGALPAFFPLGQRQLVVFDEQENPELIGFAPFPAATQLVKVGGPTFPVSAPSGWLYMDLNAPVPSASGPIENPSAEQGFVSMVFESKAKYSVGTRAVVLDDAATVDHNNLPLP
jgi:hypothetical protein